MTDNEPLVVAFTVFNRPQYLSETLDSWAQVRGLEDTELIFSLEPGYPDMAQLIYGHVVWDRAKTVSLAVAQQHLGCQWNTWRAMTMGLSRASFAVIAEDDEIVSDDIVEYYTWCRDAYQDAKDIAIVCAHQTYADHGPADGVFASSFVLSQGWGTWRDRWEAFISPTWDYEYAHGGWDANLLRVMRAADHGVEAPQLPDWSQAVFPCMSRTQHIGKHGGEHTNPDRFESTRSACFSPSYPQVKDYRHVILPADALWHRAPDTWRPAAGKPS